MKLQKLYIFATVIVLALCGCTVNENDYRETEYGYVQFKLYKEASYNADASKQSRAAQSTLDYLADVSKIGVTMLYDGKTITQYLPVYAADNDAAEYGLRSNKLKLLVGDYTTTVLILYDNKDKELFRKPVTQNNKFTVVAGGLVYQDLTVDVVKRGKVKFTLIKDMSHFEVDTLTTTKSTRAAVRQYTFDEIKYVNLTVKSQSTGKETTFEELPAKFSLHFDTDDDQSGAENYKTSSIECDTLLSLEASTYRVVAYKTFDSRKVLLEEERNPVVSEFTITDNETTKAKVKIALHEADEYIKDYYALYQIWKSLDGDNWYYDGESYPRGMNWDFNKDIDLWCDQPGVQVHTNGRIAAIDLSNFGFRGEMSPAIGQLSELIELQLGTHNDTNSIYDPSLDKSKSLSDIQANRRKYQREYLMQIHQPVQMSEPLAWGLDYHNITIPATSLYKKYREEQIVDRHTGRQFDIVLHDMNHGTQVNGLTKLPKEIGTLAKLERLFIANGLLTELPPLDGLVSCTDMELYNCFKMKDFPMTLADMPALVLLNISNNKQWSSEQINKGMTAIAKGKSQGTLQVLYIRENNLTEIGEEFGNLKQLGMLDASYNKIKSVASLGSDISIADTYLDYNEIEHIPDNFCALTNGFNSVDNFSVSHNKLRKMPNFFSANSDYRISSLNVSSNLLDNDSFKYDDGSQYKGINVVTLTMSLNPGITKYPLAFADTNSSIAYILLNACEIDEIPKGSFRHKRAIDMMSIDLSYNNLSDLPESDFHAGNMPYLYGFDASYNAFSSFPWEPLDSFYLTVFSLRGQRNAAGERCLTEWPTGIYKHTGLRGLFLGSNDFGRIQDTISTLIYTLDISDNPNIVFDASDICAAWSAGLYLLYYDKSQNIQNCDAMLK